MHYMNVGGYAIECQRQGKQSAVPPKHSHAKLPRQKGVVHPQKGTKEEDYQ